MGRPLRIPLASTTPDIGPGSVWPTAVLSGSASAAVLAASVWFSFDIAGARPAVPLDDWIAMHALLGLVAGVLVTWILRVGIRLDPLLESASERRAASARLSSIGAAATCVCFAFTAHGGPRSSALALLGLALGAAVVLGTARFLLRGGASLSALPRLDPLRVAPLVALLIVPLQDGVDAPSLAEAWRVMLLG